MGMKIWAALNICRELIGPARGALSVLAHPESATPWGLLSAPGDWPRQAFSLGTTATSLSG